MIRVVVGLLAALLACASSAVAQAPSESTWRSLSTTAWVEVCVAPCRVANPSSYVVRLTVGSAAPSSGDAPAIDLTPNNPTRDFGVIGTRVYGRAADRATRVVVEPLGGNAGGGGGSANPYPGSDYATAGRQDTLIGALGAPADAEAQTGNGSLTALSKAQRTILSNLLIVYGARADVAAATGDGSVVALTKAIRDRLAGVALDASVQQVRTALGSPFQAGGTIGNTAFGINGSLPVFATTPTFKVDQSAPGSSNAVASSGTKKDGTYRPVGVDARGSLTAPNAGTADRQITKCSIAANSATLSCTIANGTAVSSPAGICPAVVDPVITEVRSSVAAVGVGLQGQPLTTATDGTGTGTPDMVLPTANVLYVLPVAATNPLTAYNPAGGAAITVCIQTLRQ